MKKIIAVTVVAVIAMLATGCKKFQEYQKAQAKAELALLLQQTASDVASAIVYIKDERTGLCFAYYWGGGVHGGPALATVPCEAIPTNLLTIAK